MSRKQANKGEMKYNGPPIVDNHVPSLTIMVGVLVAFGIGSLAVGYLVAWIRSTPW